MAWTLSRCPGLFGPLPNDLEKYTEMTTATDNASSTICMFCRLPVNDEHHVPAETIRALLPGSEVVAQWLTKDELFPGSGQCKDRGDPLNQPGLMQRCRGRHQPGVFT